MVDNCAVPTGGRLGIATPGYSGRPGCATCSYGLSCRQLHPRKWLGSLCPMLRHYGIDLSAHLKQLTDIHSGSGHCHVETAGGHFQVIVRWPWQHTNRFTPLMHYSSYLGQPKAPVSVPDQPTRTQPTAYWAKQCPTVGLHTHSTQHTTAIPSKPHAMCSVLPDIGPTRLLPLLPVSLQHHLPEA